MEEPPREALSVLTKELTKGLHAMALDKSALLELTEALSSADDGQLMRRLLHTILQALIDAEAAQHIGADPHERTDTRTTLRNGTRDKTVSTTAGDLTVKTRTNSCPDEGSP